MVPARSWLLSALVGGCSRTEHGESYPRSLCRRHCELNGHRTLKVDRSDGDDQTSPEPAASTLISRPWAGRWALAPARGSPAARRPSKEVPARWDLACV